MSWWAWWQCGVGAGCRRMGAERAAATRLGRWCDGLMEWARRKIGLRLIRSGGGLELGVAVDWQRGGRASGRWGWQQPAVTDRIELGCWRLDEVSQSLPQDSGLGRLGWAGGAGARKRQAIRRDAAGREEEGLAQAAHPRLTAADWN